MKVLMLEGQDKHALLGQSLCDDGDGIVEGGEYNADFKKAPNALLDFARTVWEKNKKAQR